MKKFLVRFEMTEQVGPDDWRQVSQEKMFDESATLAEVRVWVLNKQTIMVSDSSRVVGLHLSQPE